MRRVFIASLFSMALIVSPAVFAQGSTSVREAQQALKEKGYDPGAIDGVNGPKTRAAVRSYQEKSNIKPDGILGPQTRDSLGVQSGKAATKFGEAGSNLKHSYSHGGKAVATGSKELGSDVKHGDVVDGGKEFGKGIGRGAKDVGVGTAHATVNAAKGVKKAITGNK